MAELIYGVPPASPNLRPLRRRWLLLGGLAALVVLFLCYLIFSNGAVGTWKSGFRYHLENPDYHTSVVNLLESYSAQIRLDDPDCNVGTLLYQDSRGCSIQIASMETRPDGSYFLLFRAQGTCSRMGGELVSGCYDQRRNPGSYYIETPAALSADGAGCTWRCDLTEAAGMERDSNTFGFTLTPDGAPQGETLTLTLSGLIRFSTWRSWHLTG